MAFPSRLCGTGSSPSSATATLGEVEGPVTAAGTTATDAFQLTGAQVNIGTAAASTGVKLPPTESGASVTIMNSGANTVTVYPQTGSTINGAASVTIATTKARIFFATSGTTWFSLLGA